jgi:hypothetical protein
MFAASISGFDPLRTFAWTELKSCLGSDCECWVIVMRRREFMLGVSGLAACPIGSPLFFH